MALSSTLQKTISDYLSKMKGPVKLLFFASGRYPKAEREIADALAEMASLSKKLSLEKYRVGSAEAKKYEVDRGPAIVVAGKQKGKVRFFGFPSGYQFPIFLMDILEASGVGQRINPKAVKKAKGLRKKTRIEVFEISASVDSPVAVKLAHDIAMMNENVTADMVDAFLFPELVKKYRIRETPATVINGKPAFTGVRSIHQLLRHLA